MLALYISGVIVNFLILLYYTTVIIMKEDENNPTNDLGFLITMIFLLSALSWIGVLGVFVVKYAIKNAGKSKDE